MTHTLQRSAVLAACADMIRACGLTLEELAAHLHDPSAPAVHVVVRPPAVRALSDNDRRVIEAAGAADGVTVSGVIDLLGLRDAQAHRYCALLTKAGHLTGVKKPGIRAMHFFSSPASAQAWANDTAGDAAPFPNVAEHNPASAALSADELRSIRIHADKVRGAKAAPPPLGARTKRVQPGKPGADMLVKGGTVSPPPPPMPKAAAAPIFTDKTIRTIDDKKRPTARWQMQQEAPDERWPSFAAAKPGIDPATGKAWEVRA
jgi:hypothetical protein